MAFYSRALFIRAIAPRPTPSFFFGPLQHTVPFRFSSEAPSASTSKPIITSTPEAPSEAPADVDKKVNDSSPISGWEELKPTPVIVESDFSQISLNHARSRGEPSGKKPPSKNKLRRIKMHMLRKEEDQRGFLSRSAISSELASVEESLPKEIDSPVILDEWSFLSGGEPKPTVMSDSETKIQPESPGGKPKDTWRVHKERLRRIKETSGISTWTPHNRLTFEEQDRLKRLRSTDASKWNIQALSEEFGISPESVIRIIKSRYRSIDLRSSRKDNVPEKEDIINADEWARLSEEEKEILQKIEESDDSDLATQGEEEFLDENDPFGDLETETPDAVEVRPKNIQRKWEARYERLAGDRQKIREYEEERAKIRTDLWGWQPLKANKKRNSKKAQAEKPVEVKDGAVVPENSGEENANPASASSTFNWALALQNKKKTP